MIHSKLQANLPLTDRICYMYEVGGGGGGVANLSM